MQAMAIRRPARTRGRTTPDRPHRDNGKLMQIPQYNAIAMSIGRC